VVALTGSHGVHLGKCAHHLYFNFDMAYKRQRTVANRKYGSAGRIRFAKTLPAVGKLNPYRTYGSGGGWAPGGIDIDMEDRDPALEVRDADREVVSPERKQSSRSAGRPQAAKRKIASMHSRGPSRKQATPAPNLLKGLKNMFQTAVTGNVNMTDSSWQRDNLGSWLASKIAPSAYRKYSNFLDSKTGRALYGVGAVAANMLLARRAAGARAAQRAPGGAPWVPNARAAAYNGPAFGPGARFLNQNRGIQQYDFRPPPAPSGGWVRPSLSQALRDEIRANRGGSYLKNAARYGRLRYTY